MRRMGRRPSGHGRNAEAGPNLRLPSQDAVSRLIMAACPPTRNTARRSPDRCGFAPTRWSIIAAARDGGTPEARQALAQLCEGYWYPLYAYIRRRGHSPEQAQDLTQEFFACLLERDWLGAADPAKGRFRAFLLACCKNFLANEHDHAGAQKRGGGQPPLSLGRHTPRAATAAKRPTMSPRKSCSSDAGP